MYRELELRLKPEELNDSEFVKKLISESLHVGEGRVVKIDFIRKSIDARQKNIIFQVKFGVHLDKIEEREPEFIPSYKDVSQAKPVIIIGAGPAGLFAALKLIENGMKPIVLERGKCIEDRKKDLAQLYKTGIVNTDSNYGYGEGGAGTFSDGKLFTRSKKKGNVNRILEILVYHGANATILIDAHPHIGSDKLPEVIKNIRKTILQHGGEVHFNSRVTDLLIKDKKIHGVRVNDMELLSENVILATGHSARDVYRFLDKQNVLMLPKEFAVGMRVEHPQQLIDEIQYHTQERADFLPPAEYKLVTNAEGKGVYSFCMCPGGIVVPAATAENQQVVNGMSASQRNTPWANSAIVTTIGEEELTKLNYKGLFGGIDFQEDLEYAAWENGGGKLYAPAQRLTDFLKNKYSNSLPRCSYKPGTTSSMFTDWLPDLLHKRLSIGLQQIGVKTKGFITNESLLLGMETRTSSPLRIPRSKDTFQHPEISGLFPCGEGAGYAGGIVSAALDGELCGGKIGL